MLQIKKEAKKRDSPEAPTPDSTTVESKSYICGEEVLVHLNDERFYLGFIAKLRYKESKCLIKFGDNTVKWVFLKNVTRMTCTSTASQFCNVCNTETMADDMCVCDICANAYHRKCHKPEVTVPDITIWMCFSCKVKQQINRLEAINSISSTVAPKIVPKIIKLPYDLNSLQWDIHHRINNLGTYCYCGGPGDWFIKMLQCCKCLQWFHEKCVTSLIYPLYLGDRFYIFLCSVCNLGTEFVRRIELDWSDLVHLALFNMIAFKPQKYYDVDINILPYLDNHWTSMYLPPKILDVPVDDRKVYVVNALLKDTKHRFEFQGKKPTNMWGLRLKSPPKPPRFSLPAQIPINENIMHHQLRNKLNLNILPPPKKTDPVINQQLTESMYSVEGLKFLHQDSHVVMLPKRLPSAHNVCIKSASPIVPAPRPVIERRIRDQELNKRGSRSSSVTTNKVKKTVTKKEKVPESRSPSRSTESTPEKYGSASEEESSSEDDVDDVDEDLDDEDDADSSRTTDLQSRRSQRLSVNRLLNGRPLARSSLPRETRSASSITLPLSLAPVISRPQVRTTKRRLSEKDLRVDRNGQFLVKRKRLRRNGLQNSGLTPTKRQSKSNCNGRTMYKSYSDFFANHGHSVHRPFSPDNTVDSKADLKTLVHSYFGASNRIANGEDYTILCKRTNPDGSEEFLISWD